MPAYFQTTPDHITAHAEVLGVPVTCPALLILEEGYGFVGGGQGVLLDSETIRLRIVIDQLSDSVRLSDRNDGSLWTKDGRYKVPSTDVTDARNTEGSIVKVCLSKTTVRGLIRQIFQVTIDLKNALV